MLKSNNTLIVLDLSDNEIGAWDSGVAERYPAGYKMTATPEGPAALADGLKANSTVQQLDASSNSLGPEGAKALAASIAENSTITSVSQQQYLCFMLYVLFFGHLFYNPLCSPSFLYADQSILQQDGR